MNSGSRTGVVWAVIVMETAVVLPLISSLAASSIAGGRIVGPVVAVGMLLVGYLATPRVPILRTDRWRIGAGAVGSLLLRLAITPFPTGAVSPGSVVGWVAGGLVPAAIGFCLWWRGGYLADDELTASDVRREFAALAVVLVAVLSLYRNMVAADLTLSLVSVLAFVGGGLAAAGMARQDASGMTVAARSRVLMGGTVALPLLAGLGVAVLLKPNVANGFWNLVGTLLQIIGIVLLFLLSPLLYLLSLWHPNFQGTLPAQARQIGTPGAPPPRPETPAWLVWLAVVVVGLLAVLMLAVVLYVVLRLLLPAWTRARATSREPVSMESVEGAGDDARAMLAGLGRLLSRVGAPLPGRGLRGPIPDARTAYRLLLRWAKQRDLERAAAQTTQQFRLLLSTVVPPGAAAFESITTAYEVERYGAERTPRPVLDQLEREIRQLYAMPREEQDSHSTA